MNKLQTLIAIWVSIISISSVSAYSQESLESAKLLSDKWFISDKSSNPSEYLLDSNITRQEMMKIAIKITGESVDWNSCRWEFLDVDKNGWSCKYIEKALDLGIISASDKFRPEDFLNKTEAVKIILKSVKLEKVQETENWQNDYMVSALEYGMIDSKYTDYNTVVDRGWVFTIAAKSLEVEEEVEEEMKENLWVYSDESK